MIKILFRHTKTKYIKSIDGQKDEDDNDDDKKGNDEYDYNYDDDNGNNDDETRLNYIFAKLPKPKILTPCFQKQILNWRI